MRSSLPERRWLVPDPNHSWFGLEILNQVDVNTKVGSLSASRIPAPGLNSRREDGILYVFHQRIGPGPGGAAQPGSLLG